MENLFWTGIGFLILMFVVGLFKMAGRVKTNDKPDNLGRF